MMIVILNAEMKIQIIKVVRIREIKKEKNQDLYQIQSLIKLDNSKKKYYKNDKDYQYIIHTLYYLILLFKYMSYSQKNI